MLNTVAYQQADGLRRQELDYALRRASVFEFARAVDVVAATTTDPKLREQASRSARRLHSCASSFRVWRTIGPDGATKLAMSHKSACNLKAYCMLCARRHAGRLVNQYAKDVAVIQDQYPRAPFVMTTLTVPNVPLSKLGDQIHGLHAAHTKMMRSTRLQSALLGWLCSTEITFPVNEVTGATEAHAHLHDLWCCVPDYFDLRHNFYIGQADLTTIWSLAAGAPSGDQYIVDIRRVRNKHTRATDAASVRGALRECLKYVSAGSEITPITDEGPRADPAVAAAMLEHTYQRRFLKVSGVFADVRKARLKSMEDTP